MTQPDRDPEPMSYDPELHDPPPVWNVHHAALQEIAKVVGNELTLDQDDTARLRGILFAALSEETGGGS